MTIPTSAELALLRSSPHETNLWLSIYKPPSALACQVNNASAANGDRVIIYDNVTAGSYGLVESGMTMYIGSTLGARDIGRIRVRSADATTITVAENSDVPWADDLYLTIVRFWEIDAVYPRIIQNTGTFETIWYKDYDIEYTDQNDNLGSLICMGSHYAGFLDGGSCNVFYSATGTHNLKEEELTYDWFFQGATVTGSSALTPGSIAYDTAGHYTTRLKVTGGDSGVVDTSYRHISIYDRPENGVNHPVLGWTFISMDGSREQGGYITRVKVRDNISDIVDGALVVIFADDWYGGTKQSIGGNALGRSTIVYVGYILDGSITYNYSTSSIEFELGSPTEIMKLAEGFAVAVNSSTDPSGQAISDENIPSGWVLVLNMDCERAMYHYLRWHSTVLYTTDFQFLGTDQNIEYFDADRESLYSAIDKLMRGTLQGNLVSDRQGKLWAEISVAATNGASGSFPSSLEIQKQDWMGVPTIDEALVNELSYLELGGIAFDFSAGSTAYLSGAPGTAPAYRGRVERLQGHALTNQAQLNTLCGNLFAYRNAKYPSVMINLVGNYRNLDIAPQELVSLSIESTENPRGIIWNGKPFHITEIRWVYDAREGFMHPSIILHEVTQGSAGTTIAIPALPPSSGEDGGGFDIPPLYIPEFPTISIPSLGGVDIYHNGDFVATVTGINFIDDVCE